MLINVAAIKKMAKEKNRRTGKDFIAAVDAFVDKKVKEAVALEGDKMTLGAEDWAKVIG